MKYRQLQGAAERRTVLEIGTLHHTQIGIFDLNGESSSRSELKKGIQSPPNFERVVRGCIDPDFCK